MRLCARRAVVAPVWCLYFRRDLVRGLKGAAQRFIKIMETQRYWSLFQPICGLFEHLQQLWIDWSFPFSFSFSCVFLRC